MLHAAGMLVEATTPAGALLLLLAVAAAIRDPLERWLVAILVVPLGLVWAAGFSYDLRNLALILPFVGAAAGTALMRAAQRLGIDRREGFSPPSGEDGLKPILRSPAYRLRYGHVAGLLALAVAAASLAVSDATLRQWQAQQQRLVGIPQLNERLYDYLELHGEPAVIATDYLALPWLPELRSRSFPCECGTLNAFRAIYDRPEVRYALVRYEGAAPAVQAYLDSPAARLVFEAGGYRFYAKADRIAGE